MATVRVGISGWRYAGWRGVFYPKGLVQKQELSFAARHFDSIEINGSFYSLQRPELYRRWYDDTPSEFLFAVKAARFITHMKKLRDVETPLANFLASGVLALEDKLGPILWQFPEQLAFDHRFEAFFRMLPHDTREAAALAKHHDQRLDGRSHTRTGAKRKLRHAVEVRSFSCCSPAFIELLRRFELGLVVADTAGRWPLFEELTADFVYVRLHGDVEPYESGYSQQAIARWAERVRGWSEQRDVFVYFDNDAKVHAPFDALALMRALGLTELELVHPSKQPQRRRRPGRPAASARD
jgi:uncharacterized protein YecE (DUF72 family)